LLAGFLIGDTSGLSRPDLEALRRAGLTHFVAVSGSNVALVLGAWWLIVAPLGAGVRLRAVTGMLVLIVFVVATRWEASVIRAATMAALGLGGRLVGVPIDAWTALGGAVAILLAVSGDLAYDVGFQLSVVATAGVLAGMRLGAGRRPRLLWGALAATVSAQAAVAPLLLLHFGTVPLLAPVANLVAAPLVTGATALAGVGVIVPWDVPLGVAKLMGRVVLEVARLAGGWPQLGPLAAAVTIGGVALAWGTRLRLVVVGAIMVAGLSAALPPGPPQDPTVTFLDVGQGDAVLLREPSGATGLVDGGRDPAVLLDALRRYGVDRLDLVVATHGDTDHVGGLAGLSQSVEVGRFWAPADQGVSDLLQEIVDAMESKGVSIDAVSAGNDARLGEFRLSVLGPQRRYAAENDGSVVLWLESRGTSVLLPGDIGAIAQRDLGPLDPDVLLVPHHGAATTDLDWLTRTLGSLAVISVGRNSYGHPDPAVMDAIIRSGSSVVTTLESGDVSIQVP
jgi:competence protein ComEC